MLPFHPGSPYCWGEVHKGFRPLSVQQGQASEEPAPVQDAGEEEAAELQEQLCRALCCLAEAQMGMAGDVQEVAEDCEALLLRAAQADPCSPEPMQVLSLLHASWLRMRVNALHL